MEADLAITRTDRIAQRTRRRPDTGEVSFRLALAALLALVAAAPAAAVPLPQAPTCQIFPATSVWNKPVRSLPVRSDSRTLVGSIGADRRLHADFGSGLWNGGPIGIPITVVDSAVPRSSVDFLYADESDPGPYPIPDDVGIEGWVCASGCAAPIPLPTSRRRPA
jgi:hypothetical protein